MRNPALNPPRPRMCNRNLSSCSRQHDVLYVKHRIQPIPSGLLKVHGSSQKSAQSSCTINLKPDFMCLFAACVRCFFRIMGHYIVLNYTLPQTVRVRSGQSPNSGAGHFAPRVGQRNRQSTIQDDWLEEQPSLHSVFAAMVYPPGSVCNCPTIRNLAIDR
jgi:hypothetical protein